MPDRSGSTRHSIALVCLAFVLTPFAPGTRGLELPAPACEGPLAERWSCALDDAVERGQRTWVGWAVERSEQALVMSDVGRRSGERGGPSLGERLGVSPKRGARMVAFLFSVPAAGREAGIDATRIRSLLAPVDLQGEPLAWLGTAGDAESVALLESIFSRVREPAARTDFGPMVAVHQSAAAALPALQRIVTGHEPEAVRAEAVAWIGYQRSDPGATRLVLDVLREGPSYAVVDEAMGSLELAEDPAPGALDVLIDLLAGHPDPRVRALVAEALAGLDEPRAVDALVAAAANDASSTVRMEAVDALADSRAPGSRAALERLARTAADPSVRREAADQIEE